MSILPVACSSSSPSGPSSTVTATGIVIDEVGVTASLEKWSGAPWDIAYVFCYRILISTEFAGSTLYLQNVEYAVIGPAGETYNTSVDTLLSGQSGLGWGGCFYTYRDLDVVRPVATSYRICVDYKVGTLGLQTKVVTGSLASEVPSGPFITSVTLTDDIQDPQKILRQRTPVTFTVVNVAGGTPPFQYRWRLNGFVLRDWDPNPVLLWDGATLGGSPTGSGGYTLAVQVRSSGSTNPDGGAAINFILLL